MRRSRATDHLRTFNPRNIPMAPEDEFNALDIMLGTRRTLAAPRERGCLTCRIRGKPCPDPVENGRIPNHPCSECIDLGIECLGYEDGKPNWLKKEYSFGESAESEVREKIQAHMDLNKFRVTELLSFFHIRYSSNDDRGFSCHTFWCWSFWEPISHH
ncbi:hypothetical protein DL93DRAFT_1334056 [Clavulina sp. PMI_390]|nr:hypothetical protein DL93DRAFT_1334056 [Clavulina sp. PMI_390]